MIWINVPENETTDTLVEWQSLHVSGNFEVRCRGKLQIDKRENGRCLEEENCMFLAFYLVDNAQILLLWPEEDMMSSAVQCR